VDWFVAAESQYVSVPFARRRVQQGDAERLPQLWWLPRAETAHVRGRIRGDK
jgi:hypothetical protein